MTRHEYEILLKEFLEHQEQKVLLIKGKWGVGKTYFWNEVLNQQRDDLSEAAYSYVSLFGINSLSELKKLTFGKATLTSKPEKHETAISGLKLTARVVGNVDFPFVGKLNDYTSVVEDMLTKNFLVCFDDIERKDTALTFASILGYASTLKEESNCRVIIILNEEELPDEDRKDLHRYRDKVIDREIDFHPIVDDNYAVIFNTSQNDLLDCFRSLEVNNLRIMTRCRWAIRLFVTVHGP